MRCCLPFCSTSCYCLTFCYVIRRFNNFLFLFVCKDTTFCFLIRIFSCKINLKIYSFLQFAIYGQCFYYNLSPLKASVMIVCSCFRVSWFHLRAFSWLSAVIMQNVTSFIQKVALHSRIHNRNFRFFQVFPTRPGLRASALSGRAASGSFWAFSPYLNHLRNLSQRIIPHEPRSASSL